MIEMTELPSIITGDERLAVIRAGGTVAESSFYASGKLVVRDNQGFYVDCNVQPVAGRELMILPEGQRERENISIWAIGGRTLLIADQVLREGRTYQVQQCEDWGSYCKATAMALEPNAKMYDLPPNFRNK